MKSPRPVEIVGGGVSGLALALGLQRRGVPVTLYEAGDYPRHRVCGEFISGLDERTSARLGLKEFLFDALPHSSVTYHLRDRALRPVSLPAPAWGISRYTFDTRLSAAFVAAGGDLRTHTRVPEEAAPPGWVFAVGRRRTGIFWVGLKMHVRDLPLANEFEVHLGDRAYVGLSRVENGAVNVCGIFARQLVEERGEALLPAYLTAAGLGQLAARLQRARPDSATFCVTAATLGDRWIGPQDRVRIGDACATIPPFTGNGLAMALQGAELALDPLLGYAFHTADWDETSRLIARAQRRRFQRRLLFASVLHPFFLTTWRQKLLARGVSSGLVPFQTLYSVLH